LEYWSNGVLEDCKKDINLLAITPRSKLPKTFGNPDIPSLLFTVPHENGQARLKGTGAVSGF